MSRCVAIEAAITAWWIYMYIEVIDMVLERIKYEILKWKDGLNYIIIQNMHIHI